MTKPVCKDCRFWWPDHGHAGTGACRLYPPIRLEDGVSSFPAADEDDWCGEFNARPDVEAAMPYNEWLGHIRPIAPDRKVGEAKFVRYICEFHRKNPDRM